MANYDRGVYEPSDDVRVFDGAEDEDDVEGSRLPLLIVLALLVLAMFAGVVWLAYTQGVARGRGETPVLTAAAGPERVAPPGGGSGTVPYQGFKIYEQPAPPDDEGTDSAPAPQAAQPAPKPAAAPQSPPQQSSAATPPKPAPVTPDAPPKPSAMTAAPPKPAPAPVATKPAAASPKSVAALIQQANSAPAPAKPAAKPVTPPPAIKQAVMPPPPAPIATGAPRQLGAAPSPKVATATPAPAAKPVGGGYVLQIGAYKSQADAASAWKDYKARHAALLAGYSDDIQQADLGAKGTWYRLRVGGLADREVAVALCDRLKADGGACILGR